MELGIKEQLRYRDISWLMSGVDIEAVMGKLGTKIHGWSGDRVIGFCPDHHLFINRRPSHPRWMLSIKTGETFCLTEGRGSNLLWTICRLFDCSPKDAISIITGEESGSLTEQRIQLNSIRGRLRRMREVEEVVAPKIVQGLDDIGKDLVEKPISQRCYDFFIKPPNKPHPTNIKKETVDRYSIFERTWGYYSDRAIIPFYMRKELKGFAAIDLLGEDEWKKKHPLSDNYRKTLTAINFQVAEYLFGFDDCQKGADWLIVTEGPREVMKLWQEGFPNAVATLGINIAPGQHRLFAELMPKNIVLMYDGDARGLAAMDKIGESFVRIFGKKHVHKCLCPNGYDPKNLSANELISLFNGLKDKGFGV